MSNIAQLLLSNQNRPALHDKEAYTLSEVKGIVIGSTANKLVGANARAIGNYLNQLNPRRLSSTHYIVDETEAIQCIPDNEIAYHTISREYTPLGKSFQTENNYPHECLLSIEMCVNVDAVWSKTFQNTVKLVQQLLDKYQLTIRDVYRKFDLTGNVSLEELRNETAWQAFLKLVNVGVKNPLPVPILHGSVNTIALNVRKGNNTSYEIVRTLKQLETVKIYDILNNWYRIGAEEWVNADYIKLKFIKKQGVIHTPDTPLNVRENAGTSFKVVEQLKHKTIIDILAKKGNWYKIGSKKWVNADYITLKYSQLGRVKSDFVNARKGPGTDYTRTKTIKKNTLVQIDTTNGLWLCLSSKEWVHSSYIKIII